jgi:hypothetical protein
MIAKSCRPSPWDEKNVFTFRKLSLRECNSDPLSTDPIPRTGYRGKVLWPSHLTALLRQTESELICGGLCSNEPIPSDQVDTIHKATVTPSGVYLYSPDRLQLFFAGPILRWRWPIRMVPKNLTTYNAQLLCSVIYQLDEAWLKKKEKNEEWRQWPREQGEVVFGQERI